MNRPFVQAAVDALNAAFAADPDAMQALLCVRIPCNEALAEHPTVQVSKEGIAPDSAHWTVSVLGVLNGAIEAATGMRISTVWSDQPINESEQHKLLGFDIYDDAAQRTADLHVLPPPQNNVEARAEG